MQLEKPINKVSFRSLKNHIKKYDYITMSTSFKDNARYLVISLDSNHLKVLPLDTLYSSGIDSDCLVSIPLSIPFDMVKSIQKQDKIELLFLAATTNPHVLAALSS